MTITVSRMGVQNPTKYYQTEKKDIVVGQYLPHLGHWQVSIYDRFGGINNFEAPDFVTIEKWINGWGAQSANESEMRWIM